MPSVATVIPLRNGAQRAMALTTAQRQRRYRERRKAQQPRVQYRRPQDRRSRPQRWQDAVRTLRDLQDEYQAWLDNLPDNLTESVLAHKLEAICDLDLAALESVEPPRGFGRD